MTIAELLFSPSNRLAPFPGLPLDVRRPRQAKKLLSYSYIKEVHAVHSRALDYLESLKLDRKLELPELPDRPARPTRRR